MTLGINFIYLLRFITGKICTNSIKVSQPQIRIVNSMIYTPSPGGSSCFLYEMGKDVVGDVTISNGSFHGNAHRYRWCVEFLR